MNCQEVIELMQRQLDNDLSASEIEILMTHTRQCPACAAMFERLKLLSTELTSLPKVTPSYSLVDAIMPELERIDRMAGSEQAASNGRQADDDTVRLSAAAPLRRRKRQRRWASWSAIGAAVAAGVVAGIFLVTYPPSMNNDDAAANSSNMIAADIANSAERQMSSMDAKISSGAQDGKYDSAGEDPYADSSTQGFSHSTASAGGDGIHELNTESGATDDGSPLDYYQFNTERNPGGSGEVADQSGAPTITDTTSGDEVELGGKAVSGQEADDMNGGSVAPDMALVAPEELATRAESPNGAYVARIVDHSIVIFSSESGEQLMEASRKNGQLGKLLWSDDSSQLTYEVQLEQGAAEKYVIKAPDWEEQKAGH
ncbi:zf-HC2 domain-containing protein [Paenibacillus sp. HB172176]|uniref:anti-sigma factor family protein n=1 Tax=Paenibacillus sp. HB172176 TaxID=2493690 RepID=UPI00143C4DE3|nr:zf-HC2 domain-containing protein [Paenibacillus sp. HB172176]